MTDTPWPQRVEQVLDGSAEFEPLWEELGEAIAAAPQDADLLRLRLQLAEAAGLRSEYLADLRRLCALLPADRNLRLALAARQHRLAWFIVDDDLDEHAQQVESERLKAEAVQWLLDLAQQHMTDGAFMAELLGEASGTMLMDLPWSRVRLLLQAAAASPANAALQRLLAQAWCALAGSAPAGMAEGVVPMGFCADAFGNLWEPLMIERALSALAPLLRQHPADAELLEQRAGLLAVCGRFSEAAADHDAIAAAWSARAAAADDADERVDAQQRAQAAQDAARLHAAGPQAVIDAAVSGIEDAIGRLGVNAHAQDPRFARLPDEVQQSLAEMDADMARTREAIAGDFAQMQQQLENPWGQPDGETRAALDDAAMRVASSSRGLVSFEPARVFALDDASIEQTLEGWLQDRGAELDSLGWRRLGWCEYPAYRAMFGRQVVGGLWVDAAGTSLAAVTSAGAVRVIDVESELEGGLQMVTTASRGSSNFGGVPGIDQLAVEPQMALEEMLALHQARLACRVAQQPDDPARVFAGVADFQAMQERQRRLKLDFRLREGISAYEALGIPVTHPGHFGPVVQEAVRRMLRQAAQAAGA